ncbi:MAG: CLC_0170 family protein [Niameybacter sp.]|uniref:CLC_0170 family protein n=1 Tax=Niameybacter sp. TaxID=2033640 RepID=UPI002FCB7D11
MAKLQEMMSIYIVLVMLGIGGYMGILQKETFAQVEHLKREARFSQIVGYIYIAVGIGSAIFLLF